jgi:predicted nucleotidyltransferase
LIVIEDEDSVTLPNSHLPLVYSEFVAQASEQLRAAFGDSLLSVVQLGSLAHGGFSERFSDIDLAVILQAPVADSVVEDAKAQLALLEPATLAKRVSLFWTVADFTWGRLRPVDQVDLHDNGQVLWGKSLSGLAPRPSLAVVRADMQVHSLPYWADKTVYFSDHLPANEREFKEYVRCLLYPARLTFTWQTGKLGGNDEAVAYLEQLAPPGLRLDMIKDALRCRNADLADTALFGYQPALTQQRLATLQLLGLEAAAPATEDSL